MIDIVRYNRESLILSPQQRPVTINGRGIISCPPPSFPLLILIFTNNVQPNMPFESDRDRYRSTKPQAESTDAELDALMPELFFAPPPQHTAADDPPIEEFNQEFEGLELNLPFEHYDDFLTALYGTTPVISTPSTLTYSTSDSIHEATSSHYSSDLTVSSDYLSYHSSNDGLYCGADDSIHPAIFSNDPPSIPLCPAEAHFDFGTSDSKPDSFGILPEDLATAIQPPSVALTPLSVHVTPTSETPDPDKPFICPHCPQSKAETF